MRKSTGLGALAAALLLCAGDGSAEQPAMAVGTSLTVGSHDYLGGAIYGDALWKRGEYSPYARVEMSDDDFQRALTVGGGTWKTLGDGLEVKAGLAATSGDTKGAGSGSSLTLEVGGEKAIGEPVLGLDYRLTSGSLASSDGIGRGGAGGGRISRAPRVRRGNVESYTAHELGGYARMPVGTSTLGLRLGLYSRDDDPTIVSETVSLSVPLAEQLSGSVALTLEQADRYDATYITLGLRYQF